MPLCWFTTWPAPLALRTWRSGWNKLSKLQNGNFYHIFTWWIGKFVNHFKSTSPPPPNKKNRKIQFSEDVFKRECCESGFLFLNLNIYPPFFHYLSGVYIFLKNRVFWGKDMKKMTKFDVTIFHFPPNLSKTKGGGCNS